MKFSNTQHQAISLRLCACSTAFYTNFNTNTDHLTEEWLTTVLHITSQLYHGWHDAVAYPGGAEGARAPP